jgi:hypothetical protein
MAFKRLRDFNVQCSVGTFFNVDELGYLVDAIVNEDKIDTFDTRPNDMSIEVYYFFKHAY